MCRAVSRFICYTLLAFQKSVLLWSRFNAKRMPCCNPLVFKDSLITGGPLRCQNFARYVYKIPPEMVPPKLTPVRLAEENNKVSGNLSRGTNGNTRQTGNGDNAGVTGIQPGTDIISSQCLPPHKGSRLHNLGRTHKPRARQPLPYRPHLKLKHLARNRLRSSHSRHTSPYRLLLEPSHLSGFPLTLIA
jgi:hypothetical protein